MAVDMFSDVTVITVEVPSEPEVITVQGSSHPVVTLQIPGFQGPPGAFKMGTITTGAPGTNASVNVSVDSNFVQTLNLTIPRGANGPANTLTIGTVSTGQPGTAATASLTGTAPNQVLSLTLPQGIAGPRGLQGANGPANTLTIGTVTTAASGASASATITGTAPNQTLNLTIPTGPPGATNIGSDNITDATALGRTLLKVADAAAARTAIGAGTSSLVIGLTATDAAAGNHTHADLVNSTASSSTNTLMRRGSDGATSVAQVVLTSPVPTATNHAVRRDYVDSLIASRLPNSQKGVASGLATLDATSGLVVPTYENITEIAKPAAPAAGDQRFYIDSTIHAPLILDSTGTARQVARYLGTLTGPLPTTDVLVGDMAYHPTYQCQVVYAGVGSWQQHSILRVANYSALVTWMDNLNLGGMGWHVGFRAYLTASGTEWTWNGSKWIMIGGGSAIISVDAMENGEATAAHANWTMTSCAARLYGSMATIEMGASVKTTAITVGADGNIANQAGIVQLAQRWRPPTTTACGMGGTGSLPGGYYNNAGNFVLSSVQPGYSLAVGGGVNMVTAWFPVQDLTLFY